MSAAEVTGEVAGMERTALSCALAYIRLGWYVLPLLPGDKRPDSTLVPRGHLDATNDPGVARQWWAGGARGVGIALRASRLLAVDVDPRNGGMETMDGIEAQHGKLESDVTAITGGGGLHIVYLNESEDQYPGTLGPGIDLKADGYIAAEPSLHPSGKQYVWEASSDPLEGCLPSVPPLWLRDLSRQRLAAPAALPKASHRRSPLAASRLADARRALQYVSPVERDTWVGVGMALHAEAPDAEGFDTWTEWSMGCPGKFDPADQMRVWRSFKHRGLEGVTLQTVFKMAQDAGWQNRPLPDGAPVLPEVAEPGGALLNLSRLSQAAGSVRWLIKGVMPSEGIGLLFGGSGSGKSFLALDMGLRVAHGIEVMARRTKQGPVVYVAAEGGAGLWRRIDAWHRKHGRDWRDIDGQFLTLPRPILLDLDEQARWLREQIDALGVEPRLIVVDTLSQTFSGNENAAEDISGYLRTCGTHLRDPFKAFVMVVHHIGHGATDRPRGSSALIANVDMLLGMRRTIEPDRSKQVLMEAELEFQKVKDGERPEPVSFAFDVIELGDDEDGDEITSLAAFQTRSSVDAMCDSAKKATGKGGLEMLNHVPANGDGITWYALKAAFRLGRIPQGHTPTPEDERRIQKAASKALGKLTEDGMVVAEMAGAKVADADVIRRTVAAPTPSEMSP